MSASRLPAFKAWISFVKTSFGRDFDPEAFAADAVSRRTKRLKMRS
jgi:hypothetical protein